MSIKKGKRLLDEVKDIMTNSGDTILVQPATGLI